jgi:hypothetical protein
MGLADDYAESKEYFRILKKQIVDQAKASKDFLQTILKTTAAQRVQGQRGSGMTVVPSIGTIRHFDKLPSMTEFRGMDRNDQEYWVRSAEDDESSIRVLLEQVKARHAENIQRATIGQEILPIIPSAPALMNDPTPAQMQSAYYDFSGETKKRKSTRKSTRKAPAMSASEGKRGQRVRGKDGRMWTIAFRTMSKTGKRYKVWVPAARPTKGKKRRGSRAYSANSAAFAAAKKQLKAAAIEAVNEM